MNVSCLFTFWYSCQLFVYILVPLSAVCLHLWYHFQHTYVNFWRENSQLFVNIARYARNIVKWNFFGWFSNTVWKLDFVKSKFCSAQLLLVYDQRRKSLKERRPWRPIVAISPFLWVGKGSFLREFGLANATEELSRRGMIKTDLPCTTDAVTQLHLFHVLCCRIRTRNQEENRAFFFSITRKGHRKYQKKQPHFVWKSPKMSHLYSSILAFSTNFCPIKIDLSGNMQASGFLKLAKVDYFWHF